MKIFAGTSCQGLVEKIISSVGAQHVVPLQKGEVDLSRFPNGENKVWVRDDVKNEIVFVLQNFSSPVDQNILQFCLMVDALKRKGAKKIVGIIPWLGYAKQNKVFREGESLAAEVVAKIVSGSGVDEVLLLDVHSENVKGFFSVPVKEMSASEIFIDYAHSVIANLSVSEGEAIFLNSTSGKIATSVPSALPRNDELNCVVVAPDKGALNRNKIVAEKLGLPLFVIDKERDLERGTILIKGIHEYTNTRIHEEVPNSNFKFSNQDIRVDPLEIRVDQNDKNKNQIKNNEGINRNIVGRSVIMVDDMILSGGTVFEDVKYVRDLGVKDVYFFSTHLNVSEKTFSNLSQTQAKKIVVTNSLEFDIPRDLEYKIEQIQISQIFANEILKYDF